MEERFRIRTREGEELRARTTEIFAEFVRSGVVRPEDLVYDALTGQWMPAALHPMVRLVRDPLAGGWQRLDGVPFPPRPDEPGPAGDLAGGAATGSGHSADGEAPAEPLDEGDGSDPTGGLDLVEPPTVSPEEEARAFIARMEEERRSSPERLVRQREDPFTPLVLDMPEAVARPRWSRGLRRGLLRSPKVRVTFSDGGRARRSRGRVGLLGLAGVASAALLAVFASVARPSYTATEHAPEAAGAEDAPVRVPRRILDTEGAVRGAAYQSFVSAVDRMRGALHIGPVPTAWLSGKYLSNPTAYPQVPRYWQRYLEYVEQARANEASLYRTAYLQALDEAGVSGPVRSLRLATALEDFDAAHDARAASYARAWDLAVAALALHDTLVGLWGRVSYEPAVGPRLSAAPVVEAAGKDPDAQARLDAALDRVLKALRIDGNTLDVAAVPTLLIRTLRKAHDEGPSTP